MGAATASRRRFLASSATTFALLAASLALVAPAAVGAEVATDIAAFRVERGEEGLLLSATVRFELPAAVDEALVKGIPIHFVAEAQVLRDRWWWTDRTIARAQRHMRLAYQPLTRRWRLTVSPQSLAGSTGGAGLGQNFESQVEALGAVQRIASWKIAEPAELEPGNHTVEFKFRLDVSQLPRPFQIGTAGEADWDIQASRTQRFAIESGR